MAIRKKKVVEVVCERDYSNGSYGTFRWFIYTPFNNTRLSLASFEDVAISQEMLVMALDHNVTMRCVDEVHFRNGRKLTDMAGKMLGQKIAKWSKAGCKTTLEL